MSSPSSCMEIVLKRIDGEDELSERRLLIDHNNPISIGRASKTETKQLVPAVHNGWIRNPVISRTHAELTLQPSGTKPPVIFLQDKKSSHGTYVNGQNIQNIKHPLQDKDEIRFGTEVMRGEETFRPPVFSFQMGRTLFPSLNEAADRTTIDTTNTGITITVPYDSSVESEGEEDNPAEKLSSPMPPTSFENTGDSFFGSQANPWTIDESVRVSDLVSVKDTAIEEDDDASSVSNMSYRSDEDVKEKYLDTEDEDPLDLFEDEEESENEDQDSESITESPIYTPKSPQYNPPETDSLAGEYTPSQFGTDAGCWPGPFTCPTTSGSTLSRSNDSMFNNPQSPWPLQDAQRTPNGPTVFPRAMQYSESSAPQHFSSFGTEMAPLKSTSAGTGDMLDPNRRTYNKTDMSINSLINPSPGKESRATSTKRKADELDFEEDATTTVRLTETSFSISNTAGIELDKLLQTPESFNKDPIETPASESVVPTILTEQPSAAVEPSRKKRKLRAMVAKAAIFGAGVVVGSAGMLGGLISLPDGFFQS